ncbi:MAG: GNAT family N-acetyltransferase [Bacteroidota bacterium]
MAHLVALDRYNWELALDIRLSPEQERFLPSVLYSLAQAKFEDLHPYGILHEEKMIGFLMYGEFGGICWLNRIMIDQEYQHQGIGQSAMRQILAQLRRKMSCKEIRTSYSRHNYVAEQFFINLGFEPIEGGVGDEVVAIFNPKTPLSI